MISVLWVDKEMQLHEDNMTEKEMKEIKEIGGSVLRAFEDGKEVYFDKE